MRILFLGILFSLNSWAATKVQFFPGNYTAMIVITENDGDQMLRSMNVPWQNSSSGPGKGLFSSDRVFNLACGQRPDGVTCSIVVQKSSVTRIDSSNQEIIYQVSGEDAKNLISLFVYNSAKGFSYQSSDKKLSIDANVEQFSMRYF